MPIYLNRMSKRNDESSACSISTAFDTRAFSFSAINFWHSIPIEIRHSESLNKLKINLKQFLQSGQTFKLTISDLRVMLRY